MAPSSSAEPPLPLPELQPPGKILFLFPRPVRKVKEAQRRKSPKGERAPLLLKEMIQIILQASHNEEIQLEVFTAHPPSYTPAAGEAWMTQEAPGVCSALFNPRGTPRPQRSSPCSLLVFPTG